MASKKESAKGSECASAWMGKTRSSTPASQMRFQFSLGSIQRSVAHTWSPSSCAKKIELIPFPHPISSTRILDLRSITSIRASVNQRAFGPISFSRTHSGSYRAPGKVGFVTAKWDFKVGQTRYRAARAISVSRLAPSRLAAAHAASGNAALTRQSARGGRPVLVSRPAARAVRYPMILVGRRCSVAAVTARDRAVVGVVIVR